MLAAISRDDDNEKQVSVAGCLGYDVLVLVEFLYFSVASCFGFDALKSSKINFDPSPVLHISGFFWLKLL